MSASPRLDLMEVQALSEICKQETDKFFGDEVHDERYCWELFRRALALRNDYAWETIFETYGKLVRGWLRQCGGVDMLNIPMEELETLSFEKFWHATSHRRAFERFSSLRSLLQYLHTCCSSTVTDALRRRTRDSLLTDIAVVPSLHSHSHTERELEEREKQEHFWQQVCALLHDEQEERVLISYYVLGLKPREILDQFPDEFQDIQDVYRVKRNIMNRLRRSEELRTLWPHE